MGAGEPGGDVGLVPVASHTASPPATISTTVKNHATACGLPSGAEAGRAVSDPDLTKDAAYLQPLNLPVEWRSNCEASRPTTVPA